MRENHRSDIWQGIADVFAIILAVFFKYIEANVLLYCIAILVACILSTRILKNIFRYGLLMGIMISAILVGVVIYKEWDNISIFIPYMGNSEEELEKDKEIYDLAIEYMKQVKYKQALEEFYKLSENYLDDGKREEINNVEYKFKEEELSKVDSLMGEKKYEEALFLLHDVEDILKNDEDILLKMEEVQEEQVKEEANNYIIKQQYVEAVDYLKGKISEGVQNASINELFVRAKGYYIEEIIVQVNEFTQDKNYSEAENILNEAIQKIGDDTRLYDKLNEIQNKKPVILANMESMKYDTYLDLHKISNYQDVFGNQYDGISLAGEKWKMMDPFYFGNSYFIAGKFRYLKGTITILNQYKTGEISFYNDGTLLIEYEFDIAQDIPHEIEIDLSGINLLDIKISGCVLANAKLYVE